MSLSRPETTHGLSVVNRTVCGKAFYNIVCNLSDMLHEAFIFNCQHVRRTCWPLKLNASCTFAILNCQHVRRFVFCAGADQHLAGELRSRLKRTTLLSSLQGSVPLPSTYPHTLHAHALKEKLPVFVLLSDVHTHFCEDGALAGGEHIHFGYSGHPLCAPLISSKQKNSSPQAKKLDALAQKWIVLHTSQIALTYFLAQKLSPRPFPRKCLN